MPWFRVDDAFHAHPKMRAAGPAAVGIWVAAGSHCMAYATDGFVAEWWVQSWGRAGRTSAARLVEAGLWEQVDGGWRFHDWADYQALSEELETARERTRKRVARWREQSKPPRDEGDP